MSDAVFAAVYKVYSTLSGRRFMSDLRAAKEKGYITRVPHFNSVLNALESPETGEVLQELIKRSALPLKAIEHDFAVDSTGFTTSRFHRWFDHKYGKERAEHDWVKVHVICGVKTNVITAAEIYERNTNDCPILPSLVKTTAESFTVLEVSADKAYASEKNFAAIADIKAQAFISFRSGTSGSIGGFFAKAFHYFSYNRDEFLAKYHKRSNVESTMMMLKSKFGDSGRSRTDSAMRSEVFAKILSHNICCVISAMYELGIDPKLGCTKSIAAAQNALAI
jgi:transposase